ncbi:MAG: transcriptional regulator [Nostoc sp. S4]|nr:transcriptional regulator [Nostoc sp. S4]
MPQSRGLLIAKQPSIDKLVRALRPELNLFQQKFAADGFTFPTINCWQNQPAILSPSAMQRISTLLNELGDRGKILQTTYFGQQE